MQPIFEQLRNTGIIPVIAIEDADHAVPLANALKDGGLPCAEITFRTAAAEQAIRNITSEVPDLLVCAGTVLTVEQVKRAFDAGAKLMVSPGLNPKVVAYCLSNGIPVIPGCATPSDIEAAMDFGLSVVKFFPAEAAGGIAMIKAMSAPYGGIRFMPTGGINEGNLNAYLSNPKVLACGGSWMAKTELIRGGRFDEIRDLTARAVQTMHGFALDHIGINPGAQSSAALADRLCGAFGLIPRETAKAVFAGDGLECMKEAGPGEHGHIAIGCNDVDRAVWFLQNHGVAVEPETAKTDANGRLTFMYLKESWGGFRIHLTLKQ